MPVSKINFYVAALAMGIAAIAQQTSAKERKSYEKSVYSVYGALPVNTDAVSKTTEIANEQFPGWVVTTDKVNGSLSDVYGIPVSLEGNTAGDKARNCLAQQLNAFGMNASEWQQVNYITAAPKADYINFRQVINKHDVVYSRLSFRFTKDGALARIQIMSYGNPASNAAPSVTTDEAKNIALQDLTDVIVSSATISGNWSWYPIPSAGGYTLHPAWHFEINGTSEGSVPLDLTGYIDATNGAILERTNQIKETAYDITVKGVVYKNGTLFPATAEPLPYLRLNTGIDTFYTDASGYYNTSLLSLPVSTTVPLIGQWSTVYDSLSGKIPVFSDTVMLPGTTYTYPTATPSSDRDVNAYYHVNRVHNFMKGYFPTFTGMDLSLPTVVDLSSGTCNAFYNKSTINFYAAGSGCNSFAEIGDIIYHEYGHGISDHFYQDITGGTSINDGALNEACSDVWAMSISRNPVLGANAFVGYGGFIRRYDMTPQVYPIDLETNLSLADVHKNGQIIAGTWWDVGVNLGSVDSMTKLFTDVYYDVPDGANGTEGKIYQGILIDALTADDNDGNLLDGTPHYNQIVAAFAKHGIYMEGDIKLTHTEIINQPENTPIPVTATLAVTTTIYLHDLTLYYRVNGTGSWNPIILTKSGLTFTGTIPPQPQGTVIEYYFVVHDQLNTPNAYFPITCNPSLPGNQTTIPYQFGVGVKSVEGSAFETAPAGWQIGGVPGDDATAGQWHDGAPVKNTDFDSWPVGDHTTGKGKCLITGYGTGGTILGTPVAGGTTTVLSPIFAINSFVNPVVEYYRWFSNEQGYENFKNDPWIVKIRNSGSAPWTTIENTYQADVNWRHRIFRVSSYIPGGSSQFQIMFVASDSILPTWADNGQSTTVGGIDDFYIYDMGSTLETPLLPAMKAEIYPNPADNSIEVVMQPATKGTIGLYDMMGRKLTEIATDESNTTYSVNTATVVAGIYNLMIQTDKSIQSKKIVIAHQ